MENCAWEFTHSLQQRALTEVYFWILIPSTISSKQNWTSLLEKREAAKDIEDWFFPFLIIFYYEIFLSRSQDGSSSPLCVTF